MYDYLDNMINFAFLSKADRLISGHEYHYDYIFEKATGPYEKICYTALEKMYIAGLQASVPKTIKTNDLLYIIIPYRNREAQLEKYVKHMKPYLANLGIPNKIIVVNQNDEDNFRLALLINIGVKYVMGNDKGKNYYFCKNDLDSIPIKLNNYYRPQQGVIHNLYGYYDCLSNCYTFNPGDFLKMNGLSNSFERWGGEDTDALGRALRNDILVNTQFFNTRNNGNYIELEDAPDQNRERTNTLEFKKNLWLSIFDDYDDHTDGINQLNVSNVICDQHNDYTMLHANTHEIIKTLKRR